MKVLLDTHLLIWSLMDVSSLPEKAKKIISNPDNEIYYSIISLWEIEIKHIAHPVALPYSAEAVEKVSNEKAGFQLLQLTQSSIHKLSELKRPDSAPRHKDPFDRILICQAIANDMIFLTHDSLIPDYSVPNIVLV